MSIVVAIQTPFDGNPELFLMRPNHHHDAARPAPINPAAFQTLLQLIEKCRIADDCENNVEEIGTWFLNVLCSHPVIDSTILPLFDVGQHGQKPLYLHFVHRDDELERMPWEALFAPNVGFLAQNSQFSVARAQRYTGGKAEWEFEAPLRIQAVLGAGGTDKKSRYSGRRQWEGLREAIKELEGHVRVEMSVLTCEIELLNGINGEGLPWVKAELIHDRAGLFASIQRFRPNLLHFFCHGASKPTPHLQVASYKDWETFKNGSVIVEAAQFAQQANRYADIWLVTLNCCESAEAGRGKTSLSMPMIGAMVNAGIPTVVGMREVIDVEFAHRFCQLFYNELLGDFRNWLASAHAGNGEELHWAHSLSAFRLCETEGCLDWTVPIMQTRLDPFRLRLTSQAPGMREYVAELLQLQEDRKFYAHQGDGSPVLRIIDQRIEQIKLILAR